ncbi:hypothetical protein ACTXT7_009883 [Hymenolepis weldensis]
MRFDSLALELLRLYTFDFDDCRRMNSTNTRMKRKMLISEQRLNKWGDRSELSNVRKFCGKSRIKAILHLDSEIIRAKSGKSITGGNSPATPVTPKADTISTPTYPEGVKEVEKKASVEKPVTQVSGSSSSGTAHQQAVTTLDAEVDGGQSDGGATPTQDESENPNDAPPVTNCFAFSQTGQMNFPPPPIQTTSTVSNNLLINILPMSLPPTFNSMSQPPWHTGLPPALGGGRPPPPQTFFPAFPPSMLSRPPNFSNLPNSQSNQ